MIVPLSKVTGVLNESQKRLNVPAVYSKRDGKTAVNLPAQTYKSAEIALRSIDGKLVLRGKAAASEAVKNISRRNVAAGVYLLLINGGGASTSRLIHRGGKLDIDVTFGSENAPSRRRG